MFGAEGGPSSTSYAAVSVHRVCEQQSSAPTPGRMVEAEGGT